MLWEVCVSGQSTGAGVCKWWRAKSGSVTIATHQKFTTLLGGAVHHKFCPGHRDRNGLWSDMLDRGLPQSPALQFFASGLAVSCRVAAKQVVLMVNKKRNRDTAIRGAARSRPRPRRAAVAAAPRDARAIREMLCSIGRAAIYFPRATV